MMTGEYMKKTQWMAGLFVAAIAAPTFAQDVPALAAGQGEVLPPVNLVSPDQVRLDGKEAYGIRLANQWKSHPDRPRRGADGSVKYLLVPPCRRWFAHKFRSAISSCNRAKL